MSQPNTDLKSEIEKGLKMMRELRDEVRVKLHLASLDAKEEWRKLEPHLVEVERTADAFTAATRAAIAEAVKRLSKLRSSLGHLERRS